MKNCPFCAEEIKDEAVKCKHCGSMLDRDSRANFADVKKGIKRVELDKFQYDLMIFISAVAAISTGYFIYSTTKSTWAAWVIGIIVGSVIAIKATKKYYEIGKGEKL